MQRHLLAVLAIGLTVIGVVMLAAFGTGDSGKSMLGAACLKVGLVLVALWLAFPQVLGVLRRWPPWILASVLVGGLIVILRPRALVLVLPILLVIGAIQLASWLLPPTRRRRPPGHRRA